MPIHTLLLVVPAVLAGISLPADSTVSIDWVTVADPGNPCDRQRQGCHGAVERTYRISKTEVTNAQYTALVTSVMAKTKLILITRDITISSLLCSKSLAVYEQETSQQGPPRNPLQFQAIVGKYLQ